VQKALQPPLEREPGSPVARLRMTLLILTLSLLAAPAALAQKVTVEFDQATDFSKYKSFAIRNGQLNSRNPALNSELVKKPVSYTHLDVYKRQAATSKGIRRRSKTSV